MGCCYFRQVHTTGIFLSSIRRAVYYAWLNGGDTLASMYFNSGNVVRSRMASSCIYVSSGNIKGEIAPAQLAAAMPAV